MYLALYRKYRSKTFDEVVSQEHITTTLKNQIKSGKLAHAYLFTGSRGTGKTTCAKLMAKAVNCLSPVDGNPCGECETCKAIAAGCPDIVEMDAASNNGVDDVRQLRDEVVYAPVTCKYRVYIIDEVHMMSGSAFNALLKTIEEPPAHVIFILATTEMHKVPATILSRCQQFTFRRIAVDDSTRRLCEIAKAENVHLDVSAAELISRLSDGGMRDAVSLLDQCISVSDNITEDIVRDTAGIAGFEHLTALAGFIHGKNTAGALKMLDELYSASKDPVLLLDELMGYFRNLMMLRALDMDTSYIGVSEKEGKALVEQAKSFTTGEIMRCIDILQDSAAKAGRSTHRKTLAEMCLIKLCTPKLDSDTAALSLRLEQLETDLDGIKNGAVCIAAAEPTAKPTTPPSDEIKAPAKDEAKADVTDIPAGGKIKADVTDIPADGKIKADVTDISADGKIKADETDNIQSEPKAAPTKPAWLYEGDDEPPKDVNSFDGHTSRFGSDADNGYDPDLPPFDLEPTDTESGCEEIPLPEAPPLPDEPAYPEPKLSETESADITASGEWAEILDELPDFINAFASKMNVKIADGKIIISDYDSFTKNFMVKGDTVSRIETAAEKVTGKPCRLIFAEDAADNINTDKRDRLTAFLEDAEKAGVNIKYKK